MKKRNLIATNCPPGVDCDANSAGHSEKTGKMHSTRRSQWYSAWANNNGHWDSPIVKWYVPFFRIDAKD